MLEHSMLYCFKIKDCRTIRMSGGGWQAARGHIRRVTAGCITRLRRQTSSKSSISTGRARTHIPSATGFFCSCSWLGLSAGLATGLGSVVQCEDMGNALSLEVCANERVGEHAQQIEGADTHGGGMINDTQRVYVVYHSQRNSGACTEFFLLW
jgi:hypothetical protein